MQDHLQIGGTSPCEEDCVQVGSSPNYITLATAEGERFIALIRAVLGREPKGATLCLKSNPHDFGPYITVECAFDPENEIARRYAYRCEAESPATWWPDGITVIVGDTKDEVAFTDGDVVTTKVTKTRFNALTGRVEGSVAQVKLAAPAPRVCSACMGYGHFDKDGKPSIDRRDRKCGDCRGEGKI